MPDACPHMTYAASLRAHQIVAPAQEQPGTRVGSMLLDHDRRELRGSVAYIRLTAQEYAVLARLSRRPGIILGYTELLGAMYDDAPYGEPETAETVLRVVIRSLRNKLMVMGNTVAIRTERNMGWALEVQP